MTTPQEDFPLTPPTHHEVPSVELVNEEWEEIIGETIGEASMCWSQTPQGIFDSDKASKLINKLINLIKSEKEKTRQEVLREVRNGVIKLLQPPTKWKECVKAYHNNEEYCAVCGFEPNNLLEELTNFLSTLESKE